MKKVEAVASQYHDRIMKILSSIREELVEDGWYVEGPFENHCDDFQWAMVSSTNPQFQNELNEDDIDITFKICESEEYDGTEGGLNFSVNIVTVGGKIIGGITPFNYTEKCWVDINDSDAVEERFCLIEEADPNGVVSLLADYK